MRIKHAALFTLLSVLLTGCTSTITNLTPSQMPRNPSGLYPFEVAWNSTQRTIREETIKPYVVIGLQTYPMKPAPVLRNRWETLIPIPPSQDVVHYRYKFEYHYATIPTRRQSSKLSPPYKLTLREQK